MSCSLSTIELSLSHMMSVARLYEQCDNLDFVTFSNIRVCVLCVDIGHQFLFHTAALVSVQRVHSVRPL